MVGCVFCLFVCLSPPVGLKRLAECSNVRSAPELGVAGQTFGPAVQHGRRNTGACSAAHVDRTPLPPTPAPGLGSPLPHLRRDWAHPCHICAGTGLTPATSAPGLGPPLPHLRRDWAHPCHICAGTGLAVLAASTAAFSAHQRRMGACARASVHRRILRSAERRGLGLGATAGSGHSGWACPLQKQKEKKQKTRPPALAPTLYPRAPLGFRFQVHKRKRRNLTALLKQSGCACCIPLSPVPLGLFPLPPVPLSPVPGAASQRGCACCIPLSPVPLSPVPLSLFPLIPVPLSPVPGAASRRGCA